MKRLIIISVCFLLIGLIIGGIGGWLIGREAAEKEPETTQLSIIEQSLGEEFWDSQTQAQTTAEPTEASSAPQEIQSTSGAHKYVLNKSRKRIHTPTCDAVKDISPDNYAETDDLIGSICDGYTQCKKCWPSE